MINFFRNIRRQLVNENKLQKYFRYAFGEVVLIVLGILIALQLQNWNEKRKQKAQFKSTLEQLYTTIKYDVEAFYRDSLAFSNHIKLIDRLLNNPDSIPDQELPYALFDLTYDGFPYTSESIYYAKNLNYDSNDEEQKELAKEVLNFISRIDNYKYSVDERLKNAILQTDIPAPKVNLKYITGPPDRSDSTYYDDLDLINLHNLVRSHKFRSILKTVRGIKIMNNVDVKNRHTDGLSIINLIKMYYPEVKVFYKDVGIIGTSINGFDDVGAKSTPMTLTNKDQNIWELYLYLKEGRVKFRCRDSWAQNWGSREFPKGRGRQDGPDIPVSEAGKYHIIFKPVTGEYQFIKKDD